MATWFPADTGAFLFVWEVAQRICFLGPKRWVIPKLWLEKKRLSRQSEGIKSSALVVWRWFLYFSFSLSWMEGYRSCTSRYRRSRSAGRLWEISPKIWGWTSPNFPRAVSRPCLARALRTWRSTWRTERWWWTSASTERRYVVRPVPCLLHLEVFLEQAARAVPRRDRGHGY